VPDLPDEKYIIKVRGIDASGLEGKNTIHNYLMDARPEPPLPASPAENAMLVSNNVLLRWSALDIATGYHLQLSTQPDFKTTLIDKVVQQVEFSNQQQLPAGMYYWRLATRIADDQGPFSDRQQFKVIPATPDALDTQGDDDHLIFRWRKSESALMYQIQVAQNTEFSNILVDKQMPDPRLEIARPTTERLYLRMRTIADNGFTSHWSSVQFIDPPATKPWYLLMLLPLLLLFLLL
jgi:hypothetical protein